MSSDPVSVEHLEAGAVGRVTLGGSEGNGQRARYLSPSQGELVFSARRGLTHAGQPVPLKQHPRLESPWGDVCHLGRYLALSEGDASLVIDFDKGARASTVSMNVQFLGAAKRSDLVCTARAVKRGRELIFTEITACDDDGNLVAHALQTYRIV